MREKHVYSSVILLWALALSSCALTKRSISEPPEKVLAEWPRSEQHVEKFMTLITAKAKGPAGALREELSWGEERVLGHSAFLICHSRGLLVVDTGLGRQIDAQFKDMPFWLKPLFSFEITKPLVEQIDLETFCPGRSTHIVLTHLHWDHASGIKDMVDVEHVWTRQSELDAGFESAVNDPGYLLSQYDGPVSWRTIDFDDGPKFLYERSFDFFGDASVVLVPMQGHSKGSVGVVVSIDDTREYFLIGDTTWLLEGVEGLSHKSSIMRSIVDDDLIRLDQEMLRLNSILKARKGIKIVPAHDIKAYPSDVGVKP